MAQGPYSPYGPPPTGPRPGVAEKVSPPAIALMVVGIINALIGILNIGAGILGAGAGAADPDNPFQGMVGGGFSIVHGLVIIVVAIVIIIGAMKMKNLESYGLAMTGSILAMIPCISCCLIGLPIGIWSLVVLTNADVKAAFH